MTGPGEGGRAVAACSCGALCYGSAPEVHGFIAAHPPAGQGAGHRFAVLLPGDNLAGLVADVVNAVAVLAVVLRRGES